MVAEAGVSGPRVSVGMPVFNGEAFLAEALDSLLAQNMGDFELIVSDNASTDGTPDILEAYAAGIPVVATNWMAIPEIVQDGVSGLLIEPRRPDAIVEALTSLMDDPAQLRALRAGAREMASQFASTRWTDTFVEICRSEAKG